MRTRNFCSRTCFAGFRDKKLSLNCALCGRVFYRTRSFVASGRGKFCSRKCRKGGTKSSCTICGKIFYHRGKETRRFCSKRCQLVENHSKVFDRQFDPQETNWPGYWYSYAVHTLRKKGYVEEDRAGLFRYALKPREGKLPLVVWQEPCTCHHCDNLPHHP